MGNRAVITTAPFNKNNIGIYLHWNGGRASIEGFMQAARELGYRTPDSDAGYGLARLVQAIGLYLGADKDTSLGIGLCKDLDCDNLDNGTYLIGANWEIVGREFFDGSVEEINPVKTAEIAATILRATSAAVAATKEEA